MVTTMNKYWKPFSEYDGGAALIMGRGVQGADYIWTNSEQVPSGCKPLHFCPLPAHANAVKMIPRYWAKGSDNSIEALRARELVSNVEELTRMIATYLSEALEGAGDVRGTEALRRSMLDAHLATVMLDRKISEAVAMGALEDKR